MNKSLKINSPDLPWCVVYTRSRFEKKVQEECKKISIETFVPLHKQLKQWSDRKKWVEEPLIRSYVFLKINDHQKDKVLSLPGVVQFVKFEGKMANVPDDQIETLKIILGGDEDLEIPDFTLNPGDPVKIISGKLQGISGELVQYNGNKKVLIRIDHVYSQFLVNISPAHLKIERKKMASCN